MLGSRTTSFRPLKDHTVLIYSVLTLLSVTLILLLISSNMNGGKIVNSYDDAYIHMAMAKNFAQYGVWGITKYGFTSSSSSLVWTSLLALIFFIFGPNEYIPLMLNILISIIIIISVYLILKKESVKPSYIITCLTAVIFLTPLPPLIMTGLEHPLHILISILFIYLTARLITEKGGQGFMNAFWIVVLSMILPSIRYEGLVLVFVTAFLILIRKRWKLSITMIIFSVLPVYLFGIISLKKGWSFFPNSLLLKGDFPDIMTFSDFFSVVIMQWVKVLSHISVSGVLIIIVLVVSLFFVYYKKRTKNNVLDSENIVMLFLLGVNIALYLLFSQTGWSYRYQSFLVAISIFVVSLIMFGKSSSEVSSLSKLKMRSVRFGVILLLFVVGIYFSYGGIITIVQTPRMTTNIFEQQYQMAMFIQRYYEHKTIGLNDIGTSNYFADINCADLWGLADLKVSQKRRTHTYSMNDIREEALSKGMNIAIVYDSWFADGDSSLLPSEWIKIGEWKIMNNIISGDDVISFYAVGTKNSEILAKNLWSFSTMLPKTVIQSGKYTEQH